MEKISEERAKALAEDLSAEEKIGLLFLNSWKMGMEQEDKDFVDETGLLDEKPVEKGSSIFATSSTVGTTETIKDWKVRTFILRSNPKPDELADWINEMNSLAEEGEHFIPVMVVSNSRNENGEVVFGMNDASGVFAAWPGTMGIAAAVKGDGIHIIDDFADCIRRGVGCGRHEERIYVHGGLCHRPQMAENLRYFWRRSQTDQRNF